MLRTNNNSETPTPVSVPVNLPIDAPISSPRDTIDSIDSGEDSNNSGMGIVGEDNKGAVVPTKPPREGTNIDETTQQNGSGGAIDKPNRESMLYTPNETESQQDSSSNNKGFSIFITIASLLMPHLYSNSS